MRHIYSIAVILASTGSRDSTEGLFHWREPLIVSPVIVATASEAVAGKEYIVAPCKFQTNNVSEAPGFARVGPFSLGHLLWENSCLLGMQEFDCWEKFPDGLPKIEKMPITLKAWYSVLMERVYILRTSRT